MKARKPGKRAPQAFQASESILDFGRQHGFSESEIRNEIAAFLDHEFARPKTDWDATFRNWLRKSERWRRNEPETKLKCAELPESITRRQPGETVAAYEHRIADAMTAALYPNIAHQFQGHR